MIDISVVTDILQLYKYIIYSYQKKENMTLSIFTRYRRVLVFFLAAMTAVGVRAMELNDALAMAKTWASESRASSRDIRGSMKVDERGGFLVMIKGAIFRYEPVKRRLLVSGLVGYDVKVLSEYPARWDFLVRAGERESTTMMYGEARFELLREPLLEFDPDVVLLTKTYTERLTDRRKLRIQIDWLLLDADYWFVNRYNEVMGKSEADLIKEAPALNQWMLKNRPKPW